MRCVAIVQARLGSTRLPGKVLLPIKGKPMIQQVFERARAIPGVDQVVLAVPEEDLQEFYLVRAESGCGLVGGPRDDVLARYVLAAQSSKADVIVRITGDCPLLCPEVASEVLGWVAGGSYVYATNDTRVSGWPDGLDVQVFTRKILEQAHLGTRHQFDREHVCPYMERNTFYRLVERPVDAFSTAKLSVDTQADLDRVRRIMARIPAGDYSWAATKKAIEEEKSC